MSKRDYGIDEDYWKEDPGNKLRDELSRIDVPLNEKSRALGELLYTAEERGIIGGIDRDDVLAVYRIVALAMTIEREQIDLDEAGLRM
jgi:hypothetical protein